MINFDDYTNENKSEHNLKWPYSRLSIQSTYYKRFRIRKNKCIIDKIYLCAEDLYEAKYQHLINKR